MKLTTKFKKNIQTDIINQRVMYTIQGEAEILMGTVTSYNSKTGDAEIEIDAEFDDIIMRQLSSSKVI